MITPLDHSICFLPSHLFSSLFDNGEPDYETPKSSYHYAGDSLLGALYGSGIDVTIFPLHGYHSNRAVRQFPTLGWCRRR